MIQAMFLLLFLFDLQAEAEELDIVSICSQGSSLNTDVSFTPQFNELKTQIRAKVDEEQSDIAWLDQVLEANKRIMRHKQQGGNAQLYRLSDEESYELLQAKQRFEARTNDCSAIDALFYEKGQSCRLDHVANQCGKHLEEIKGLTQLNLHFSSFGDKNNEICRMEAAKDQAVLLLQKAINQYNSCAEELDKNIFKNQECINSYKELFAEGDKQFLSNRCNEDGVELSQRRLVDYIKSEPLQKFCQAVNSYRKMRAYAVRYAQRLSDFDESIENRKTSLNFDVRSCQSPSRNTASAGGR